MYLRKSSRLIYHVELRLTCRETCGLHRASCWSVDAGLHGGPAEVPVQCVFLCVCVWGECLALWLRPSTDPLPTTATLTTANYSRRITTSYITRNVYESFEPQEEMLGGGGLGGGGAVFSTNQALPFHILPLFRRRVWCYVSDLCNHPGHFCLSPALTASYISDQQLPPLRPLRCQHSAPVLSAHPRVNSGIKEV